MRIAVWHNLPSGGGKRALDSHVRGLVARGHSVESWCPPTADSSYLPLGEIIPERTKPLDRASFVGRNPLTRWIGPYKDMTAKLAAMDRHCRACADEINAGGFDVLFANSCMFFRTTSIGRHVAIPRLLYLKSRFGGCTRRYRGSPGPPSPPFARGNHRSDTSSASSRISARFKLCASRPGKRSRTRGDSIRSWSTPSSVARAS